MRLHARRLSWLVMMLLAALPLCRAAGAEPARFIVRLRESPAATQGMVALAARHGLIASETRPIGAGMQLLRVQATHGESAATLLAQLQRDPQVEFAVADVRRHALAMPDDALFASQWYLQDAQPAAVNALAAWAITTGSPGLVIAALDTGVRFDHPDLRSDTANRLLPGYNFISSPLIANNSYGRGPDASDPGDWVSASDREIPLFIDCPLSNSSWHGTRVAGILGALTNNAQGIAGTTWQGWIEPVRVLGKCGGYDSDIIAGMAWAAGLGVAGAPQNPYPARVLNMSLGAAGPCPASYQAIINQLIAAGVLVVAAAGNEGGPVDAPANCLGVAAVGGLREVGTKVGFSSLGPQIALSAPAGNCVNTAPGAPCLFSVLTTTNSGTTVPESSTYTNEYNYNIGTSFAAPLVSATAGLMLAVNGNLTPAQLIARLKGGAVPFPLSADPTVPECHVPVSADDLQTSECNCTPGTCGAGMTSSYGAVLQAQRPIAAVALPAGYSPGSIVTLDASGSAAACNSSIASYHWTVLESGASPLQLGNTNGAQVSVLVPSGARYLLQLTVSDEQGRTDSATVEFAAGALSSSAPEQAGSRTCLRDVAYAMGGNGSGGGGSLEGLMLFGLLVLALRRAYSMRCAASSQVRCARR
jgi:serine protease